jgi:hypothetical protein
MVSKAWEVVIVDAQHVGLLSSGAENPAGAGRYNRARAL